MKEELFISVDVETSGPVPGLYSLLSIGACLVEDDRRAFECQLKPLSMHADPKALEVTGFSLEQLARDGLEPALAMEKFAAWVNQVAPPTTTPVFVGLNAGFDWSFVNYYFHSYLGNNPFGFAPLDIKALYMGVAGTPWSRAKSSEMVKTLGVEPTGDHNALHDARFQAALFRSTLKLRDGSRQRLDDDKSASR